MTMRASASTPIDADALLASLSQEDSLLLAVSGGPDSVALMLLVARWSLRERKKIEISTVDHELRPDSAEEARLVADWAQSLGFRHRILSWRGPKPKTRIQERAREARYRLLARHAKEIGAGAIVTAHHADDQSETILFRLLRGSGVAGLAGMSPISAIGDLRLHRPLLGLKKAQLETICAEAGQKYFKDPSNEDPKFARAKLRPLLASLAAQGLDSAALLRLGARAQRAEEGLSWSVAKLTESARPTRDESSVRLDANALRDAPQELLQRLIAGEIARLELQTPVRLDRLERTAQKIAQALNDAQSMKTTLGGALLTLSKRDLVIAREEPRKTVRAKPFYRPGSEDDPP
jgi:tRNA(Ile)-lysidine synthase